MVGLISIYLFIYFKLSLACVVFNGKEFRPAPNVYYGGKKKKKGQLFNI